ncbi:response regulator transcription factor [Micromonospora sp. NBRC 101691]|uniref:helix-turn-helix transcriptional regulator n=1 Tax=Micromonospora TaxID=1873 RepID=UPI0024A48935|nr:response regulator transcription factor [Micromonospora sp. NBRC 101691]GLY24581.1 helix-turn-helix transcriptional regulator [Micromonospora sp. NBRC 101691]
MVDPVHVSVIASDPVLEAGATSALRNSSHLIPVSSQEPADVTVVIVDEVGPRALDVVRGLRNATHRPEVVLVATELIAADVLHAIAAGARGLLRRREADSARLTRTVLAAAQGDCAMPPDMLTWLLEESPGNRAAAAAAKHHAGAGLSERERAVLKLVAEGRETHEIARELCYSTRTVVSVVHDITHRFRLRNRAHAVAYALRAGLL